MASKSANQILSRYAILQSIRLNHYTAEEVENDTNFINAITLDLEDLISNRGPASAKTVVRDLSSRRTFQRGVMNSLRGTWGSTPIFQPKTLAPESDIKKITINDIIDFANGISEEKFDDVIVLTQYAQGLEINTVIDDTNHGVLNSTPMDSFWNIKRKTPLNQNDDYGKGSPLFNKLKNPDHEKNEKS